MISIVIVNYNGMIFLKPCLDSLYHQTFSDFEVIIVDNASTDESISYIKEYYPDVRLVLNRINRGFAGGANDGIRLSCGKYIFLLNTDTVLPPLTLERLINVTLKNSSYGMFGTKMLYPDGRINSTGICISLSGAAWDRGMGEQDIGQYDHFEEILGPCGGAALYRRDVLVMVGGFDEDFFLFMEDVDLAIRIQQLGYRCLYVPNALVYHHHGGTAGVGSDISIYYGNRNIIWYPVKNYPGWLLFLMIPWMVGRTIGVIGYYVMKGKGKIIVQAKYDGIRFLPQIIKKRREKITMKSFTTIKPHMEVFALNCSLLAPNKKR
jgi:GT2 family glycosyltransferase